MIEISVDLGNIPSVLAALANPQNAQFVANAMAERYVTDVHDWIDDGRSFRPQYGHLQQATNWRPKGGGVAEVYILDQTFQNYNQDLDYRFNANPNGYAMFVEKGTRPHVIRPNAGRKGIKIPAGGGYIIRRSANHPGSRPHPFFFADQAARAEHMQAAGLSVLARIMANG